MESEANPQRHAAALLRYKWYVLAATVLGTVAGFAATRQIETQYEAQSTILIERSNEGEAASGPIRLTGLLRSESWIDLLKTDLILDHVVHQMRLRVSGAATEDSALLAGLYLKDRYIPGDYRLSVSRDGVTFILSDHDGKILQRGKVGGSVGADLGFFWLPNADALPAGLTVDFSVGGPRDVAARLAARLRTELDRDGNVLRLSLRGGDPQRTAATVNAVANRYVDVASEVKTAGMRELAAISSRRLEYAVNQLEEARAKLEEFWTRTAAVPRDRVIPVALGSNSHPDPEYGSYFSLTLAHDEIRRTRKAIQHILDIAPDSGLKVEALELMPTVKGSHALSEALLDLYRKQISLRGLLYAFTEEYSEVRALREQVRELKRETIPILATELLARLETDEANLERRIGSGSSGLGETPSVAIEEARLRGRVDAAEALFGTVQDSHDQVRFAAANVAPPVSILDPAVAPRLPISDKLRLRLIILGFLSGISMGLLGAVLYDRLERRLRPRRATRSYHHYSDHYDSPAGRLSHAAAPDAPRAVRRSQTSYERRPEPKVRRPEPDNGYSRARIGYFKLGITYPEPVIERSGASFRWEDGLEGLAVANRGGNGRGGTEPRTSASGDISAQRRNSGTDSDVLRQLKKERFRRYQTRYWK